METQTSQELLTELLTAEQAARYLGTKTWRIYDACTRGQLTPTNDFGRMYFTKEALDRWTPPPPKETLPATETPPDAAETAVEPLISPRHEVQTTVPALRDAGAVTTHAITILIGTIFRDRENFLDYPPFQRIDVWGKVKKKLLIDSILRGMPIDTLTFMQDTNAEGRRVYQVINGQQRLATIFGYLNDEFATMTEEEAERRMMMLSPVFPGCKFRDLPQEAKNRLLDYTLMCVVFPKEEEDVLAEIFVRYQNQEKLTQGEQLFIRNGRARAFALELLKHPFWKQYKGGTRRREPFVLATILLTLEIYGFPLHLKMIGARRTNLAKVILGDNDNELTETLKNTIWNNLSGLAHLAGEIRVRNTADMITLYEAAMLLNKHDIDLFASEEGCLNEWFWQAKRALLQERLGANIPETRMTLQQTQRAFWTGSGNQESVLLHTPGLVPRSVSHPREAIG